MSKNINVRIALKRDTSANWTNHNPVLLNGELILVDTAEGQLRVKIGDGIKTYTQLPFMDEALRALITEVDNNNSKVVLKDLINKNAAAQKTANEKNASAEVKNAAKTSDEKLNAEIKKAQDTQNKTEEKLGYQLQNIPSNKRMIKIIQKQVDFEKKAKKKIKNK